MVVASGLAGLAWGLIADRVAARWPAHEDGAVRALDWRTIAVVAAGGISVALVVDRFRTDLVALGFLLPYVVALVLLFATDLDQRLLPDVVTLPLVGYAVVGFVVGAGPFVRSPDDLLWAVVIGVALPAVLLLISVPFGAGAIGIGDLKLLLGVGLIAGAWRLAAAIVAGAIVAALAIVLLIAARRITLKSYVPYGPFLIVGALWAILSRSIA